jgi:hypothetical protein
MGTEPSIADEIREVKLLFQIRDPPDATIENESRQLNAMMQPLLLRPQNINQAERKVFVYGPIPNTEQVGIYMIQS